MSLRDDFPNKNTQVTFIGIDYAAHDDLTVQVNAFLGGGGKITVIPTGKSAYQAFKMPTKIRPAIQPTTRAASNIIERKKRGNSYYVVKLMNEYFGTSENWSLAEAKENRDKIRAKRGLPPVEY